MRKKLIKVLFEHYNSPEGGFGIESAWAERINDFSCRLDNILFYAKEYALNDILSIEEREGEFFATGVLMPSGHSTVRILFSRSDLVDLSRNELRGMNCESEISDIPILISVDIPPNVNYSIIEDYLIEGEKKGLFAYEEACIAHKR